ncbi:MAG: hypothetical protein HYS52_00725 [Candidatus Wildermuthbacteria bacterium]|nr:hypothetical protein [Candidatus Wildermuthbacteria bacterium]
MVTLSTLTLLEWRMNGSWWKEEEELVRVIEAKKPSRLPDPGQCDACGILFGVGEGQLYHSGNWILHRPKIQNPSEWNGRGRFVLAEREFPMFVCPWCEAATRKRSLNLSQEWAERVRKRVRPE